MATSHKLMVLSLLPAEARMAASGLQAMLYKKLEFIPIKLQMLTELSESGIMPEAL
jgi:hypothetical protein